MMTDLAKTYKESFEKTGPAKRHKSDRWSSQFLGFLLVGITAGTINILSRLLLSTFLIFEAAVALAFLIALTVAFVLNRTFVFANTGSDVVSQYAKFAVINLIALIQVWGVSVFLVRYVFPAISFDWHAELIGHAIGVASPLLTTFFFYRFWIFPGSNCGRAGRS
jgi:putative flippase GtrA